MLEALRHTPNWVYLVFFLVLHYGVMQCFSARIKPRRLLTMPLIFLGWSAYATFAAAQAPWISLSVWGGSVCGASLIGLWLGRRAGASFHADDGVLDIPGSKTPLVISLLFFGCSYWFGYTAATAPDVAADLGFQLTRTLATASCIGLFVGRAAYLYALSLGGRWTGPRVDPLRLV
ncbi:hypothetical protein So717_33650 [Roseobacter cerasinus]|uniref:Uncharacterized protein n=1 Tax=Roseobacter cerasinus TaxID=2602289 RepID=A0A640VVC5_9RHOB|nr:DUF6622 family protein [Roseobacter cerasinus]GFE51612.1 hypothetical protein So717_33650 [Roseobacter cerasinus]